MHDQVLERTAHTSPSFSRTFPFDLIRVYVIQFRLGFYMFRSLWPFPSRYSWNLAIPYLVKFFWLSDLSLGMFQAPWNRVELCVDPIRYDCWSLSFFHGSYFCHWHLHGFLHLLHILFQGFLSITFHLFLSDFHFRLQVSWVLISVVATYVVLGLYPWSLTILVLYSIWLSEAFFQTPRLVSTLAPLCVLLGPIVYRELALILLTLLFGLWTDERHLSIIRQSPSW